MAPKALHFVLEEMLAWAPAPVLARHRYGCRVLDRPRATPHFFFRFKLQSRFFFAPFYHNYLIFCLGHTLNCSHGRHNILQETKPSTTEPGTRKSHICEYEAQ